MLENADSLNTFVKKRLTTAAKSNMTTDDIWNHFASFCKNREISLMKKSDFLHDLPDVMEQVHGLLCRNDIIRNGKAKRGYQGITLAELN